VVCDGRTDAAWVAMDLFSQAEHDEDAQSILISPDVGFLAKVKAEMERLLQDMPRAAIIRTSLEGRGALIAVRDLDEAAALVNEIAPEHLELSIEEPMTLARKIRHAGAIFLGRYTAEAVATTAPVRTTCCRPPAPRAFLAAGVYDFQKRTSLIQCSPQGASDLGKIAAVLAHGEGLIAHARSAEYRIKK